MGAVVIPDGETGLEVETLLLKVPRLGRSSTVLPTCSGKLQSPPLCALPCKATERGRLGEMEIKSEFRTLIHLHDFCHIQRVFRDLPSGGSTTAL